MMDLQDAPWPPAVPPSAGSRSFVGEHRLPGDPARPAVRGAAGDRFDGHDYVAAVAAQGAVAAMVGVAGANPVPLPLLVVDDTRLGLGRLALAGGRFELPLIGVTGSNGKTSVKEMCAAILRAQALRRLDPGSRCWPPRAT